MSKEKTFIVFILDELYYLPIYEPVANELRKKKLSFLFLIRKDHSHRTINTQTIASQYLKKCQFPFQYLEDDISNISATYCAFSANGYMKYDFDYQYTILMSHGIGTKGGYFDERHTNFDIRFVEGEFRMKKMQELFPDMKTQQFNVGFAKLDPAVNMTAKEKASTIEKYQLDPTKKTILYSPTFYPSTIERIKRNFPKDLQEYNIIIKPHAFSYEMNRYSKQRRILKRWSAFSNVYLAPLEEFNLTPFMSIADIMVTDESSAMFEFIALDKPMICYRDVKLRLTYRLFPNKLKKRMEPLLDKFKDSFANAYSYKKLLTLIETANLHPDQNKAMRHQMSELLVGKTDGKVSERIIKHLSEYASNNNA